MEAKEENSGVISEYADWLKRSISSYEALAKSLIKHKAEKGRIVEGVVKSALRAILPGRFGIGTGFAITSSGRTSSQLDLILYDGHFNTPIVLEGGTGLFPIECIYGFVEVKSRLDGNEIDSITQAIGTVRGLASEKRYAHYVSKDFGAGPVAVPTEIENSLPPRAFAFAINSDYADISGVEAALAHV